MSMTTTLTWVRYDGTPATLPQGIDVAVVLKGADRVYWSSCILRKDDNYGTIEWWHGVGTMMVQVGDLWAPWPEAPKVETVNGHVLYECKDFTSEQQHEDQLARLVCDGGLGVCKICGAAEIELDNPCPGPKAPKV